MRGYINPNRRTPENASDFDAFEELLEECLIWPLDSFNGDYPWDCDIPPREEWQSEINFFNEILYVEERKWFME